MPQKSDNRIAHTRTQDTVFLDYNSVSLSRAHFCAPRIFRTPYFSTLCKRNIEIMKPYQLIQRFRPFEYVNGNDPYYTACILLARARVYPFEFAVRWCHREMNQNLFHAIHQTTTRNPIYELFSAHLSLLLSYEDIQPFISSEGPQSLPTIIKSNLILGYAKYVIRTGRGRADV